MHQESRHVLEIGLARQIGVRSLTIARAQTERHLIRVANQPGIQLPLDLPVPGLKAKVFVHHDCNAGLIRGAHQFLGLAKRRSEWFLANAIDTVFDGQPDKRQVAGGWCRNVQEVRL